MFRNKATKVQRSSKTIPQVDSLVNQFEIVDPEFVSSFLPHYQRAKIFINCRLNLIFFALSEVVVSTPLLLCVSKTTSFVKLLIIDLTLLVKSYFSISIMFVGIRINDYSIHKKVDFETRPRKKKLQAYLGTEIVMRPIQRSLKRQKLLVKSIFGSLGLRARPPFSRHKTMGKA